MISFNELGLRPELLRAIEDLNFENPTPIQEKTIPALLEAGPDIIGLAQTGTGKTAAFGLPLIQLIDVNNPKVQALILCPTRELCIQITKDLDSYSKYVKGFNSVAVYGGASIQSQIRDLKSGCRVVVGTPGRTLDLLERKALKINDIKWLVLDEADEMLNMGFKEDLDQILEGTPKNKQTLLFSATMPSEIRKISAKYMREPVEIAVGKKNEGAENVNHEYYIVQAKDRYAALKRIVDINPNIYGLIFCRTRQETKDISSKLMADGYNADTLHGDLSQAQRDHAMQRFRSGVTQLLVATDVAARGLDVNDLSHVINYNLPDELEVYIHRSGRTGRAGKKGNSITIIHSREVNKIYDLQKMLGKKFELKKVPAGREVCEKQLFNLIDKMEKVEVDEAGISQFMPAIYKKLEWLDREQLIKQFVSLEFNRFLSYYEKAADLNVSAPSREKEERFSPRNKKIVYSRFYMNLGMKHDLSPQRLMGLINEKTHIRNIPVGKIDMMRKFTFFEVDREYEQDVIKAFRGYVHEGTPVVLDLSKPDTKSVMKEDTHGWAESKKFRKKGSGKQGKRKRN
jgi:ATP-dependent RNA helicase DeaD